MVSRPASSMRHSHVPNWFHPAVSVASVAGVGSAENFTSAGDAATSSAEAVAATSSNVGVVSANAFVVRVDDAIAADASVANTRAGKSPDAKVIERRTLTHARAEE